MIILVIAYDSMYVRLLIYRKIKQQLLATNYSEQFSGFNVNLICDM